MKTFFTILFIVIFTAININAADGLFDIYMTREQVKKDVITFINSDKGKNIIGQAKGVKAKADIETKKTMDDLKEITKIVKSVPPVSENTSVAKKDYGKSAFSSKGAWYKDTVYENYYK